MSDSSEFIGEGNIDAGVEAEFGANFREINEENA
jgi:hypothetical protein